MKCIVIGLGNFGVALSQRLTMRGNEVLAVDSDLEKVNKYKDSISSTVALDVTNEMALRTLPLKEVDVVFVVLGKEFGTSLLVIALLKQIGVKRIVARSISAVHSVILKSMGITELINPEKEYADFFATKVELERPLFLISWMITISSWNGSCIRTLWGVSLWMSLSRIISICS